VIKQHHGKQAGERKFEQQRGEAADGHARQQGAVAACVRIL
jgi:hypothetical protein